MINKKQVAKAVDAVLALMKKEDSQVNITDQTEKIDIQLTLKQIPQAKHKNIHISLPHSPYTETHEVCIFVKDLDKNEREYEATVQHYEELFRKHDITCISKIVPLKALRTDYSMYSAKRSLAKAYDLYLSDDKVFGMLPGLLGKIFFNKKITVPVTVNLDKKELKNEIEKVVMNSRCVLQGTGPSSSVNVANDRLSKSEILSNVLSVCDQLSEKLPGGKANIKNLHLKGSHTIAVPLYMAFDGSEGVDLKEPEVKELAEYTDEITTVEGARVKIRADGHVEIIPDEDLAESDEEGESGDEDGGSGEEEEIEDGDESEKADDGDEEETADGDEDAENKEPVDEESGDEEEEAESDNESDISEPETKVQPKRAVRNKKENTVPAVAKVVSGPRKRTLKEPVEKSVDVNKKTRNAITTTLKEKITEKPAKKGRKAKKV